MKYVYKLKFDRFVTDDNGNYLFSIDNKPTLQAQVMLAQSEIQQMDDGIFGNPDIDVFEKLAKEIRLKL